MADSLTLVECRRGLLRRQRLQYLVEGGSGTEIDLIRMYLNGSPLVSDLSIWNDSVITFTARSDQAAAKVEEALKRFLGVNLVFMA